MMVSYNELSFAEGNTIIRDDDVMIVENLEKDEDAEKAEYVVKVEDDSLKSVEFDTIDLAKDQRTKYIIYNDFFLI